jgi:hypothetical protein
MITADDDTLPDADILTLVRIVLFLLYLVSLEQTGQCLVQSFHV